MDKNQMKLVLSRALLLGLPLACGVTFAAQPVDLSKQNISALQSFVSAPGAAMASAAGVKEIRRSVDFNQTLHVRVNQTYAGYKVWGGDAIIHIPHGAAIAKSMTDVVGAAKRSNGSMDGTMYQNLSADLATAPAQIFEKAQADKALQQGVNTYQRTISGTPEIKDQKSSMIVYVDKDNKAHWAFLVSFHAAPVKSGSLPAKPVYIMDATTFQVYQSWDDIKTIEEDPEPVLDDSLAGGSGGNEKMGKLIYDGLTGDLPKLGIKRDAATKTCYWQNKDVTVKNYDTRKVMTFQCEAPNPDHDNVYWIGDKDAVNGGYSPSDDALFGGIVIKNMYQQWYKVPVLTEDDGKPMILTMVVHDHIDNAYWDGRQMTFGDGVSMFYPLTSLGVAAHEISHGFTEQHSGLAYYGQSGGMNEAFSDMAAQAAEFYAYSGKNSWMIGPEIFKAPDRALRYMDKPSKDCHGGTPGNWCSIDDMSQYHDGLDVHFSSGIYNRVFYLIGSADGWTARKAFDVMVKANMDYWTSTTNFAKGACGVMKATMDYGYSVDTVINAFKTVGVDTKNCIQVPPAKS